MSPNDDFRRELNHVFDDISGSPDPGLRDRVRSAVAEAPVERSTYWIAAVAACLITALIVGILYVNNPFRRTGIAGPVLTPTPTSSPTSQPSPSPSPSAQPVICSADTVQPLSHVHPWTAYISDLRAAKHDAYDRLVIDFANGVPATGVELIPQKGTSFDGAPSGQPTTTRGTNGIKVIIRGADLHTSYSGSRDLVTGFPRLAEVRQIEDFEGVVQLALGVNGPACYSAFYLTGPDRLVIDITAAP